MSAEMFGALEAGGYALAALCAIAAIVVFFTQDIRAVRDEMTGRAAERAIEEMRAGKSGTFRAVSGGRSGKGAKAQARGLSSARTSGSLHVRFAANGEGEIDEGTDATAPVAESEQGTTLLGCDAADTQAPASEQGTTLLSSTETNPAASEQGTTLLSASPADALSPSSEAGTTLLEADISVSAPSEAGTTLLGKGEAR